MLELFRYKTMKYDFKVIKIETILYKNILFYL